MNEKDLNKLDGEINGIERFLQDANIGEKRELKEVPIINEALREELGLIQTELKQYVDQCKRIDKNNLLISEKMEYESSQSEIMDRSVS